MRWGLFIYFGEEDASSRLVGRFSVEAEEGAARIASFSLREAAGGPAIDLVSTVGKQVTIYFARKEPDGTLVDYRLMFFGYVDVPDYDLTTRVTTFRCTDDLQGALRAGRTVADLEALTGGFYSSAVFEATTDYWRIASDIASTVPGALDLTPERELRWTPWAAKAIPDVELTDSDVVDGSLALSLASRAQLINTVDIEFTYRFPRLKRRIIDCNYVIPGSFINFLQSGYWFLTRSAVNEAIAGSGWSVLHPNGVSTLLFVAVPPSQVYPGPIVWNNDPEITAGLCLGFNCLLSRYYAQRVVETWFLRVWNDAAVLAMGERKETLRQALDVDFDDSAWEQAANEQPVGGSFVGFPSAPAGLLVPEPDIWEAGEQHLDFGLAADSEGDLGLAIATDRAAAQKAIDTLLAIAKTRIVGSHRQNQVSFSVALDPGIDVDKTVALSVTGLSAVGKVASVLHEMDLDTGSAVSTVSIAISSLAGVGFPHPSGWDVEPDPLVQPTIPPGANLQCSVQFGYLPDVDHVLEITTPEVDDASRLNKGDENYEGYFQCPIPEDLFEVLP